MRASERRPEGQRCSGSRDGEGEATSATRAPGHGDWKTGRELVFNFESDPASGWLVPDQCKLYMRFKIKTKTGANVPDTMISTGILDLLVGCCWFTDTVDSRRGGLTATGGEKKADTCVATLFLRGKKNIWRTIDGRTAMSRRGGRGATTREFRSTTPPAVAPPPWRTIARALHEPWAPPASRYVIRDRSTLLRLWHSPSREMFH